MNSPYTIENRWVKGGKLELCLMGSREIVHKAARKEIKNELCIKKKVLRFFGKNKGSHIYERSRGGIKGLEGGRSIEKKSRREREEMEPFNLRSGANYVMTFGDVS